VIENLNENQNKIGLNEKDLNQFKKERYSMQ
jgi:hypothetical protein